MSEGRHDVILSPTHKIGDVALKLEICPQDMIGSFPRKSIVLYCEWPGFNFGAQSVTSKAFHSKTPKLTADVVVQHPTVPSLSISRTVRLIEPLNARSLWQGVEVRLAETWAAFQSDGWLGSCEHVLVIVTVTGDFNIFVQAGLEPTTDDLLWKMWDDPRFADFHIAAKGREIRCHRSVLAAASPVFEAMVDSEMQEGCQAFVSIDEAPDDLLAMLEFIYTERLPRDLDCLSFLRLLRLADCYQLSKLFQICKSLILPSVTSDNIAEVVHGLASMDCVPECKVMFDLLLYHIQRDIHLVATIAKDMVQARAERKSSEAEPRCPQKSYMSSPEAASVGVQCGSKDDPGSLLDEAQQHWLNAGTPTPAVCLDSAIPHGPCSSLFHSTMASAVFSRESLLRFQGSTSDIPELGFCLGDRESHGPHRKTRRGTHGRNDHDQDWRAVQSWEPAPSCCTYDSWR